MTSPAPYVLTDSGNKISRACRISGPANIMLAGRSILREGVAIRGDLKPTETSSSDSRVISVRLGRYCILGRRAVVRPPCKLYKGSLSYYPLRIGDCVSIGDDSLVEAASVGKGVQIGSGCIISPFSVLKDFCYIEDHSVVAPGTVVPSLTRWAGNPARLVSALPDSTPEIVEAAQKKQYAELDVAKSGS